MSEPPSAITLHRKSGVLELRYPDGSQYTLPAEFLRVHSPSAEVRGHGKGQAILQTGKQNVRLLSVEGVGHYAIKLSFDDGHDSGIYSWDYLRELCVGQQTLWDTYLRNLEASGASRTPQPASASLSEAVQVITIPPLSPPKP